MILNATARVASPVIAHIWRSPRPLRRRAAFRPLPGEARRRPDVQE
jgi:hypothetical protein